MPRESGTMISRQAHSCSARHNTRVAQPAHASLHSSPLARSLLSVLAPQWEKTRDTRVGTWRDFMTKKSKKSKGGSVALGGLKPPKMKESGAPPSAWQSRELKPAGRRPRFLAGRACCAVHCCMCGLADPLAFPLGRPADEDKRYIQRPVGEQFRPPPPKR